MTKTKVILIGLLLLCTVLVTAANVIPKSRAEQIALHAVGGGTVLLAQLELQDNPPRWSIDVQTKTGAEDEVWVQAYTGKVLRTIPGG